MLVWNGYQMVNVPDAGPQMPQFQPQMQGQFGSPIQPQMQNYAANNAPKINTNVIRVYGIEGAKNYPLPPNSEMVLHDNDYDIEYYVTVDGTGKREVDVLDLLKHKEEPPIDFSSFATKDDIAALRKEFSKKKDKEED